MAEYKNYVMTFEQHQVKQGELEEAHMLAESIKTVKRLEKNKYGKDNLGIDDIDKIEDSNVLAKLFGDVFSGYAKKQIILKKFEAAVKKVKSGDTDAAKAMKDMIKKGIDVITKGNDVRFFTENNPIELAVGITSTPKGGGPSMTPAG